MITSLFAATISNMDTGLNKNTGLFIRSFYHPVLRPDASEAELMRASRIATFGFGVMIVLAAFLFRSMSHLSLFNLMQQFVSLVSAPLAMPLLWGLFVRRVPAWSGWSTVLVCLLASLLVGNLDTFFGAGAYGRVLGFVTPLAKWEVPTVVFSLGVVTNVVVGSVWFLGTSLWYRRQPSEYHATVDAFFTKLATPVDFQREQGEETDRTQLRLLGTLGLAYGGFVLLLAVIPNPVIGRAAFVLIGAVIGGIGALLWRAAKKSPPPVAG
jgi:Na+/proline symporter